MTNIFGEQSQGTWVDAAPVRQGRSRKRLRTVIEHDGRVWIARYEGRPGCFFGSSRQEANNNLQVGAQ